MSEFLLELYSEEIPPQLQINARNQLKSQIEKILSEKEVNFNECLELSSPTRLTICLNGLPQKIKIQSKEIKGPKVGVTEDIIKSFVHSKNISEKFLYKKKTEKGEFYFAKTQENEYSIYDLLIEILPKALSSLSWKKSMKWSTNTLMWGRPLRSIFAIFNGKKLFLKYHHLESTDTVTIEQNLLKKSKKIKNFKEYKLFLKKNNIFIDQNERKKKILDKIKTISKLKNYKELMSQNLIAINISFIDI